MTARRVTIELGKLTELLASGNVAGAQELLDRHSGRAAQRRLVRRCRWLMHAAGGR